MNTTLYIIGCPNWDWGVLYLLSNISDKKVYEGSDWYCGAVDALAHTFGCPVVHGEFKDDDFPGDGLPPDKIRDVKGGLVYLKDGKTIKIPDPKGGS